jgi:hypothetical protein
MDRIYPWEKFEEERTEFEKKIAEEPEFRRWWHQELAHRELRERGELPQFYMAVLEHLYKDYSDELPQEDVRNLIDVKNNDSSGMTRYKCQGHFSIWLSGTLEQAYEEGILDPALWTQFIKQFEVITESRRNKPNHFLDREDINLLNDIIRTAANYISGKYHIENFQ